MANYSLQPGDSHTLSSSTHLKITAYSVGAKRGVINLDIEGADVKANRAMSAEMFYFGSSTPGRVVVSPVGTNEFGLDQAVRIRIVSQSASGDDQIELPVVRVDGLSRKEVGEIVPLGNGSFTINAFGSTVDSDLPPEAVTILSALRNRGGADDRIDSIEVFADASAADIRMAESSDFIHAANVVRGIADHYSLDLKNESRETFAEKIVEDSAKNHMFVGRTIPQTSGNSLSIFITASPSTAMSQSAHPTLLVVIGKHALEESALVATHRDCGVLTLDDRAIMALTSGQHSEIAHLADTIHDIVGER